jgi:hypothetical protein
VRCGISFALTWLLAPAWAAADLSKMAAAGLPRRSERPPVNGTRDDIRALRRAERRHELWKRRRAALIVDGVLS